MINPFLRFAVLFATVAFFQDLIPSGFAQHTSTEAPAAAAPVLKGFPFTNESLAYTVEWPSGLSLGEGHLSATSDQGNWNFELTLDAGLAGFDVKDTYTSSATSELCFTSLSKDSVHGPKKTKETVTFDRQSAAATRHSNYGGDTGGTTRMQVNNCTHDALTYLFYTRRELGQGRVPPAQEIIFGALYHASQSYAGAETIVVHGKSILTDKMVCHIKGPASDFQFDAYFDRDPARTPVSIRVPLPVGKISLEIVR
jgi:hypothetical protein